MANIPQEQNAAVRQGSGHDATAPVQKIAVPEVGPGQILAKFVNSALIVRQQMLTIMLGSTGLDCVLLTRAFSTMNGRASVSV